MSYDIYLLLPKPGEDPRDLALRDLASDEPISEEVRARAKRVVAALREFNPALDVFESDTAVELTDVQGGSGIQVGLYADSGSLSLPYWHEEASTAVLATVSHYLRVVVETGGFVAFDPQSERPITAESSFSLAPGLYAHGVSILKSVAKKPWWKFW